MSGIPVVDVCVPALDRDFDLQKEDRCKRKFRSPQLLASVSVPATSMFQYAWARLSKGGRDAKLGSAARLHFETQPRIPRAHLGHL